MAKTREQKTQALENLVNKIKQAKSVVFANFQGLKVSESEALRNQCREQNVGYVASKKTLLQKALEQAGHQIDAESFAGGVAVVLGNEDEVAPAQLLHQFAKKHELSALLGGILEGKYIDADKVKQLAQLPSKQELLSRLVGSINAPVSGLVNVMAGNIRGLVNVLNAIKDVK